MNILVFINSLFLKILSIICDRLLVLATSWKYSYVVGLTSWCVQVVVYTAAVLSGWRMASRLTQIRQHQQHPRHGGTAPSTGRVRQRNHHRCWRRCIIWWLIAHLDNMKGGANRRTANSPRIRRLLWKERSWHREEPYIYSVHAWWAQPLILYLYLHFSVTY